jgi:phage terminase large subunit
VSIKFTDKQREALRLIDRQKMHYFFPGGARAGKTFFIIACMVVRALKYPKSRHLVARHRYNHAKVSIFMDTLPKVVEILGCKSKVKWNKTDTVLEFDNGSEIWIDGLDSSDRVEKILGREYVTIFFNEVSQIGFHAITTVRTRLAQNVTGCHNMAFYDCNPTGRGHWANKEFIRGINPETGVEYTQAVKDLYFYMNMTPYDNAENLPDGFIENSLETLPESKRKRFLLGEWTDPEGVIFQNWSIVDKIPDEVRQRARRTIGLDFGYSVDPAVAVDCYQIGDEVYFDELVYETGLLNNQLATRVKAHDPGYTEIYADSAEPKSIQELKNHGLNVKPAVKGQDSIRSGIDYLLGKKIYFTSRSANCINEAENYAWKKDSNDKALPEPIDDYNHFWDAARYGTFQGHKPKASVPSFNLRAVAGI